MPEAQVPVQLDLFADTPIFHLRAVVALGRLDVPACRAFLEEHGRSFRVGPPQHRLAEAADWLEREMPGPGLAPEAFGSRALRVCRALRESRAEGFCDLGEEVARTAARSLALRTLERARGASVAPSLPLAEGLPWGVFLLWAGDVEGARAAIEAFIGRSGATATAYLALGDTLWSLDREHAALIAYREGYLADPEGDGWRAECPALLAARRRLEADPEWGPAWWAVGAYLEAFFPPFGRTSPEELSRRRDHFLDLAALPHEEEVAKARLFAAGLLLSEAGRAWTGSASEFLAIRRTLQRLNPGAWARHLEGLE